MQSTYMSIRVPPQWVDGEVDVKVKLEALRLRVCVFYLFKNHSSGSCKDIKNDRNTGLLD